MNNVTMTIINKTKTIINANIVKLKIISCSFEFDFPDVLDVPITLVVSVVSIVPIDFLRPPMN